MKVKAGEMMSIRKRLVLSNIAMILIPVFLFMIAAMLLINLFLGNGGVPWNPANANRNDRLISEDFSKLKRTASMAPEQLDNQNYRLKISSSLADHHASLILRKTGRITFQSSGLGHIALNSLPAFGSETTNPWPGLWIDHRPFRVLSYDFYYPDGTAATLFIVRNMQEAGGQSFIVFPILLLVLLLILIITNGTLTYFVSRSIIRPVNTLMRAAEKIGGGNLDFHINSGTHDELGKLSRSFEIMRRKLKNSIEQQVRYEENRSKLIASISHDLKTPITSIKGYVEGIRDGVANSPKKMERYLTTIYKKSIDMDRMIDELSLYSKLDMNRLPYHFEQLDLKAFLSDLTEKIRFDLEKQGVSLTFHTGDGDYSVWADREKLKRVVSNITGNSVKYNHKKQKKIQIDLSETEDAAKVVIEDNGSGISEEALPFIFDRFYRADPARNSGTGGSGLGLAIVRRMVEDHGGKVWAESTVDEGTRICFTIKKGQIQKGDPQ